MGLLLEAQGGEDLFPHQFLLQGRRSSSVLSPFPHLHASSMAP